MKAISSGDGAGRDKTNWDKMLGSCSWCSRVGILGKMSSPGRLPDLWLV